ncbi:hypothetical protein [Mitsuokella sp. WILCCON 0060]|uniref:hypothetical protein n=1 Tax=unclassified Mitsuokella TaxID=2637239 RepID=UPI003F03E322
MRMTRRRRRAWLRRCKEQNEDCAGSRYGSRLSLRRFRDRQRRQRQLRQSLACLSAGSLCLLPFLHSRALASGSLQPWTQSQEDLKELSQTSHEHHERQRLAKEKDRNAQAEKQAQKELAAAQQHLEMCQTELRIYQETQFHNQLIEERRAYWQQETAKAAAARDKAELFLTDKQVRALEIERQLRALDKRNTVRMGMSYASWSGRSSWPAGADKGSQLVWPLAASYAKDGFAVKAAGGFLWQHQQNEEGFGKDFASLLDLETETSFEPAHSGPRGLRYILGLRLPTGRTQSVRDLVPDGLGTIDYVHRGWEVTPGMEFSYHYTKDDVLKTRFDITVPGHYRAPALQGWQPDVHPGNRYRQSLAYLHSGAASSYMLKAVCMTEEKSEIGNLRYRPGTQTLFGGYAEHYVSSRDAMQAYAASFRQLAGRYSTDFSGFTGLEAGEDGRCSGILYGLGWRHEENPFLLYYARASYMKMGGTRIEPSRYLLQKDVRRWSGVLGMERLLREDLSLGAELSYYKQNDGIQGDSHGWQSFVMLQKLF